MNKCISFLVELKWNKNTPFSIILVLVKNKTLLVIAHRLNTIRDADNIIVIKEGNIVEQGTHNELIALNGIYKNMVELQNKNNGVKIL